MKMKWIVGLGLLIGLAASAFSFAAKDSGELKDQYLKVGDIKIHYLEAGAGDRALIFVTGWTMPAEVWKEQIPYFAARGFRVLAIDPRGQGLTTKTETGNTYQQHAADLHAFLQSLNLEHSYLVGWGAGATTLLDYISSPESLKPDMMVFVDCSPMLLRSDDYPGVITAPQARKFFLGFQDDRAKATEQFIRGMFKSSQPESLIKDLVKSSLKTPMDAAAALYFDLFSGDRRQALLHIPVPSLFITTPENQAVGEYLKDKTSRSDLKTIEGAGSAMFLEKPQAFNQILESFFGEN
jgi:non-heme chloroperoxidase